MSDPNRDTRYFRPLEQTAFMKLGQAASLKGLLKPFKGKRPLEDWASQCFAMRDELIALAQRQVLAQANGHPFHLLTVELAQQTTGAGTAFLRWRKHDRSAMGVALWKELIASKSTPANLLADLHAIELQRIVLNMQISVLHTLGRQAAECAAKAAEAEDAYLRRMAEMASRRAPGKDASP
ncbi:DUF3158 family protein [Variovorax paradoxus]|jgi:hypothetical protein|uniref:DUF3158 family protein n=1 Tax=Variovorax paradoxus TaxID=34073 RepID=A0A0H2M7J9_VARPD|nr:DUF3158 family protein [Variovorax paradoxus]KLN58414.1 hypothetical protein VPARA_05290 [Variovorax paradoxus]